MDEFEHRQTKSFIQKESDSSDQYSYESRSPPKSHRSRRQNFSQLFQARQRFCKFAQGLGAMRHSELREDILSHCEHNTRRQRLFQRFMSDETILRLINLRIQKMIKNRRIKKNWSEEDVQILVWIISKYADKKSYADIEKEIDDQDWQAIAKLIPGVTAESCMFKWLSLKKTNLAANNWSRAESDILSQLVTRNDCKGRTKDSRDWKIISQKLFFQNHSASKIFRNAKQCRQHWNCYLNLKLKKGPWRHQQDIHLLKCIKENSGSKKWSQIVKQFNGRTENALKNRYTLIIQKQKKNNKHKSQMQIIEQYLTRCYLDQFTNQFQEEPQQQPQVRLQEQQQYDYIGKHQESVVSIQDYLQRRSLMDIQSEKNMLNNVTPVKIQVVQGFSQFLSQRNIDVGAIQFGKLSNGVFQKSEPVENQTLESLKMLKLHRFNSMS